VYCNLPQSHIVRHLETIHRREQQVQELAKMSRQPFVNCVICVTICITSVSLQMVQMINAEDDAVSYVQCESCYAYVHRKQLYRHKCPVRCKSTGRVAAAASLLLPAITSSSGLLTLLCCNCIFYSFYYLSMF